MPHHTTIPQITVHQTAAPAYIHHQTMISQNRPQTSVHQTTAPPYIHHTIPQIRSQTSIPQIRAAVHQTPFQSRLQTSFQQTGTQAWPQTTIPQIRSQTNVHQTSVPQFLQHTIPLIRSQATIPQIGLPKIPEIRPIRPQVQQIRPLTSVQQKPIPQIVSQTQVHQTTVPSFMHHTIPTVGSEKANPQIRLYYLKNDMVNINNIVSNMSEVMNAFIINPSEFHHKIAMYNLNEFHKNLYEQFKKLGHLKDLKVLNKPEKEMLSLLKQQISNLVKGIDHLNILLKLFARDTKTLEDIKFLFEKILTEYRTIKDKIINLLKQNNEQIMQKLNQSSSSILGLKL